MQLFVRRIGISTSTGWLSRRSASTGGIGCMFGPSMRVGKRQDKRAIGAAAGVFYTQRQLREKHDQAAGTGILTYGGSRP